eukprot:scpid48450/ scgid4610/ Golgin-45; Basic leucine zipper nuclear factor 1; JEM-1; p45 basic leucine-zipper nuclear factor
MTNMEQFAGPSWPTRYQGDGMESSHGGSFLQESNKSATHCIPFQPVSGIHGKSVIPPLSLSGRSSPQLPAMSLAQPVPLHQPAQSAVAGVATASSAGAFTAPVSTITDQPRTPGHTIANVSKSNAAAVRGTASIPAQHQAQSSTISTVTSSSITLPERLASSSLSSHSRSSLELPAVSSQKARNGGAHLSPDRSHLGRKHKKSPDTESSQIELEHLRSVGEVTSADAIASSEQACKKLLKEKAELTHQLVVQRKRNGELKRLLVASIGDDLQERFDGLCHENAESTELLSVREKELQLLRERVEHLAIQCDVYQSKYRASSVMIEELSSLQSELQGSLVESRGVIHQLLTEQRQVFGDLRFTYQQLSVACQRLQHATNTTTAVPVMECKGGSGANANNSSGVLEVTTGLLSRHCSQLSAWCSNNVTSLLQALHAGAAMVTGNAADGGQKRSAHGTSGPTALTSHTHVLDNVQWRPSNAESVAHSAVLSRLPHYTKARPLSSSTQPGASLGLSSTWKTLDYSTYAGCSQCKGQVQII